MSDATSIEWTDTTWNPVRGCSKVSAGCTNCYAERTAARQVHGAYAGLVRIGDGSPRWTGEVRLVPEKLEEPFAWRRPRRVFVNSMSDLFHEKLSDGDIGRVWTTMMAASQHTFQVLTKRASRMRALAMPHPENIWLGVSVENQAAADERIPLLLETPAAVRFLSVEPLLGPVDISRFLPSSDGFVATPGGPVHVLDGGRAIDWVIVGGESGPGARPCDVAWIRSVVEQCKAAGVPCFVKQLGAAPVNDLPATKQIVHVAGKMLGFEHAGGVINLKGTLRDRKGGDPDEWPADLRVREFPEAHE